MDETLIVRTILPPTRWKTTAMDSLAESGTVPPPRNGGRSKPSAPAAPDPAIVSVTAAQRAIAIAWAVEEALMAGHLKNYSDAARQLGMTKPRLHDYVALLALSPRIVEAVVQGEVDVSVRGLTWLARSDSWVEHERWLSSAPLTRFVAS